LLSREKKKKEHLQHLQSSEKKKRKKCEAIENKLNFHERCWCVHPMELYKGVNTKWNIWTDRGSA